jgi:hypothetical protein
VLVPVRRGHRIHERSSETRETYVALLITQRRRATPRRPGTWPERGATASRKPACGALREARSRAAHALAAPIAPVIALMTPVALGLSGDPVHEPVHGPKLYSPAILLLFVNVADDIDLRPAADPGPVPGPTVLQTGTAQVGLSPVACGDACRIDRRRCCIPRMSHIARIGLRSWTVSLGSLWRWMPTTCGLADLRLLSGTVHG